MNQVFKALMKEACLEALYEFANGGVAMAIEGVDGSLDSEGDEDSESNGPNDDKKDDSGKGGGSSSSSGGGTGPGGKPKPDVGVGAFSLR